MSHAEAIIHAGDICTVETLRAIEALGPATHAVHGNVDEPALRKALPAVAELNFAGRTIVVMHDAGPRRNRLERLRARYPEADAVIFGHSHLPLHETDGEFQIFNPGSPTERRRAPRRSMGLAHLAHGVLSFEHVWFEDA